MFLDNQQRVDLNPQPRRKQPPAKSSRVKFGTCDTRYCLADKLLGF